MLTPKYLFNIFDITPRDEMWLEIGSLEEERDRALRQLRCAKEDIESLKKSRDHQRLAREQMERSNKECYRIIDELKAENQKLIIEVEQGKTKLKGTLAENMRLVQEMDSLRQKIQRRDKQGRYIKKNILN